MAPGDDTDSGVESLSSSNMSLATSGSKDITSEKARRSELEDDIDDEVRTIDICIVGV
jgi:hypothetical protein